MYNINDWKAFQSNRYDQNSLISDPMFVDPLNHDYRLRYDSVGHSIGIEDIDQANIGLTDDFPYANPTDPLKQVYVKTKSES